MAEDFRDALRALLPDGGDSSLPEENVATMATDDAVPSDSDRCKSRPRLDIFFEKKGRGGKKATIVAGFPDDMSDEEISALASRLKQRLGAGGSSRGGEILIQGDRRSDLRGVLESLGWKVRVC
ncbi:translation initiation factor [uncultured Muribaculum sp.]|uniref:translation initiation factor n=1 Tax=uncultured Muribaculum sp. TaxID=1918613 RepID=UPI0025F2E3FA|nr:translation initiation factor [uncultured Muribaculum sp.]